MSVHPYGMPKWRHRRGRIALALALVALLLGTGAWLAYDYVTDKAAKSAATPPDLSNGMPTDASGLARSLSPDQVGIPPYGPSESALKNDEARYLRDNNIEFYNPGCRDYPTDNKLQPQDLIPNANVNIVLTFDHKKREYVAKADRRVKFSVKGVTVNADGEGGPHEAQEFVWSYTGPVHFYNGVAYNTLSIDGLHWTTYAAFPEGEGQWSVLVDKSEGANYPIIAFLATDTSTCQPGDVSLTDEENVWESLGHDGILKPQNAL